MANEPAYEYHGKIYIDEFTAPKEWVCTYPIHPETIFESVEKTVKGIEDACLEAFHITPSPNRSDLD